MKTLLLTTLALLAAATTLLAKTGWDDDFEKSLAKAKEEKKMVLLDFTGSDWCGYCIKLDEEVFSKSAFKKFAKENLVLVELDFPRGKSLPKGFIAFGEVGLAGEVRPAPRGRCHSSK